jgi:predicted Zn-dependent protease
MAFSPRGYTASLFSSLELSLEKNIGQNCYQSIIDQKKVVHLPEEETEHLNAIFKSLVNCCGRKQELEFSLTVVEDETVNAFALPAGYIFVHTGLLSYVQSDGELAGVLAHEIAHVDRKHSMNAIKRQLGMSLLLQLILNKKKSKEGLAKVGNVAINMTQLGYGREAEYEADHYGVYFMEGAGYQREEILNFWRRIVDQRGGQEDLVILQLFSTHPPTSERIKRIEGLR